MNLSAFPAIVLSAGAGQRLGVPKGLYPVGGKPWLAVQLEALAAAGLSATVAVLGYSHEEYFAAIPALAAVVNEEPARGQFSSLQCGLRSCLSASPPGVFVLPVDTPCPGAATFRALAQAGLEVSAAIPEFEGDGGHPVFLEAAFARSLLGPGPDRLDARLFALPARELARVPGTDTRVTLNLNTAEDFAAYARGAA